MHRRCAGTERNLPKLPRSLYSAEAKTHAMLTTIEKILFIAIALGAFYFAGTGFYQVFKSIRRGKPEDRFDRLPERIGRALWIVVTQQSVFKKRPLVSFLHALV